MTEPSSTEHDHELPADDVPAGRPSDAPAEAGPAAAGPPAAPGEGTEEPPARSGRGMLFTLLAAVALLVVALITFILVNQRADEADDARPPSPTLPAGEFVTFEDPQFGFAIDHPGSWTRLNLAPGNRRLVVQEQGANAMSVSVLGTRGQADLRGFARTTIAQGSSDVQILAEQEITLGGAPGFYFLYTFRLDGTGPLALHAHYFLVRDGEMLTLVFQAAPATEFERLAGVFDQIADSLRFIPITATTPAPATTTTAAP